MKKYVIYHEDEDGGKKVSGVFDTLQYANEIFQGYVRQHMLRNKLRIHRRYTMPNYTEVVNFTDNSRLILTTEKDYPYLRNIP